MLGERPLRIKFEFSSPSVLGVRRGNPYDYVHIVIASVEKYSPESEFDRERKRQNSTDQRIFSKKRSSEPRYRLPESFEISVNFARNTKSEGLT